MHSHHTGHRTPHKPGQANIFFLTAKIFVWYNMLAVFTATPLLWVYIPNLLSMDCISSFEFVMTWVVGIQYNGDAVAPHHNTLLTNHIIDVQQKSKGTLALMLRSLVARGINHMHLSFSCISPFACKRGAGMASCHRKLSTFCSRCMYLIENARCT